MSRDEYVKGREMAREKLIEPTAGNGGVFPQELLAELVAVRGEPGYRSALVGMVISLAEEAAGILAARRLESTRSRALEEKLAAAERTIRDLTDRAVGRDGGP